jgi:hypothetical protein
MKSAFSNHHGNILMIELGVFDIAGAKLRCLHCNSAEFFYRPAQAPDAAPAQPDPAAWLAQADVYACHRCGELRFFMQRAVTPDPPAQTPAVEEDEPPEPVEALDMDEVSQATDCLACGAVIPAGRHTCSACGWTYLTK